MEGPVKQHKTDEDKGKETVLPVIVQMIGEEADQFYYKGCLTLEDIQVCRGMLNWGPNDRQDQVTHSADSREAQVLRKIFEYEKQEDSDKWYEQGRTSEWVHVPVEALLEAPCYVVVFQDWQ